MLPLPSVVQPQGEPLIFLSEIISFDPITVCSVSFLLTAPGHAQTCRTVTLLLGKGNSEGKHSKETVHNEMFNFNRNLILLSGGHVHVKGLK